MRTQAAQRKADGPVFKRNGKWGWQADAVAGSTVGKRRQVSRQGYPTQEEAEDALRRFIANRPRYREDYQEPERITVRDYLERWIASKECNHTSQPIEPTTAEGYRKAAQNIIYYVGDKFVDELTAGRGFKSNAQPMSPTSLTSHMPKVNSLLYGTEFGGGMNCRPRAHAD